MECLEQRLLLAQDLLITHAPTHQLLRIDGETGEPQGAFVASGAGGLVDPWDPEFGPDGNLYVISNEPGNERILGYDGETGGFLGILVDYGEGGFSGATDIEFGPDGKLYAATHENGSVLRFDVATGAFDGFAAQGNGIRRAIGIAFGADGLLYLLDVDAFRETFSDRILRFDPTSGEIVDEFVPEGFLDDAATIQFGPDNRLYVGDASTAAIHRFSGSSGNSEGVFVADAGQGTAHFDLAFGTNGYGYVSTTGGVFRHDIESGERSERFAAAEFGSLELFPAAANPIDLNVVEMRHPNGFVQGEEITISYDVRNESTDAVFTSWDDVLYLSKDDAFDLQDIEIGRVRRDQAMAPGASYTETVIADEVLVPLGDYHVIVVSDRRGEVVELDRENNVRISAEPISVVQPLATSHDPARAISVGRTLSTYTTNGLTSDDEIEIRYTVYNRTQRLIENAVLNVSLADDVQLVSASLQPTRQDNALFWNIGALTASGSRTVAIRLTRDSDSVIQMEQSITASGTLNGLAVHDDLGPALLRSDPIDQAFLAATLDADSTDPYVLAMAADLNQDPHQIIDHLSHHVAFESYAGSLRGARGTLWAGAGNSLDEASLAIALLRASGIPARYVQGVLPPEIGSELITSMFLTPAELTGFVPSEAIVSDPANDPTLLREVQDHFWIQMDLGNGWENRDTALASIPPGETLTAATDTFHEIDETWQHRVTLRVNVETYHQASAAFALTNGLGVDTVLEETYVSSQLVGRPLTIGHRTTSNALSAAAVSAITHTYSPYIRLGDEAIAPSDDRQTRDKVFQEVFTNFPLGNTVVTGVFLEVDVVSPGAAAERLNRTLFDRIGFAARNGFDSTSVSVTPDSAPSISPFDLYTVGVWTGDRPFETLHGIGLGARNREAFPEFANDVAAASLLENPILEAEAVDRTRDLLTSAQRLKIAEFEAAASGVAKSLGKVSLVKSYLDRPRILIASSRATIQDGVAQLALQFDIRSTKQRVLAFPGQNIGMETTFNAERGFIENEIESKLFGVADAGASTSFVTTSTSVRAIFEKAYELGITPVTLLPGRGHDVDALNLSADAIARISLALSQGRFVVVPSEMVFLNGQPSIGWYEGDAATGETIGVLEDGTHGINETVAEYAIQAGRSDDIGLQIAGGFVAGMFGRQATLVVAKSFGAGIFKLLANDSTQHLADLKNFVGVMLTASQAFMDRIYAGLLRGRPAFATGFALGLAANFYAALDPPLSGAFYDPNPFRPARRQGRRSLSVNETFQAGAVATTIMPSSLRVEGELQATWSLDATTVFSAATLAIPAGEVFQNGLSIGHGEISLVGDHSSEVHVQGNATYSLSGQGSVATYHRQPNIDGAFAGDWRSLDAQVTGDLELEIFSESLLLDGSKLPPGSYTIRTSVANLAGEGAGFASPVPADLTLTAEQATVSIGKSDQDAVVSDVPWESPNGAALTGFDGQVAFAEQNQTWEVTLSGSQRGALAITSKQTTTSVELGETVSMGLVLQSNVASSYLFHAEAPTGWQVETQEDGQVQLEPPAGIEPGWYVIRLAAQSLHDPQLVAHAEVPIEVTSAQEGLSIGVEKDDLLFLPINGAQVATSFRATIRNLTAQSQVFDLAFPNSPASFNIVASRDAVKIPAGGTAVIGLYLDPTGQLLPPGTDASFDVAATSRDDPGLTETTTVSFSVPEIHGLILTTDAAERSTSPDQDVQVELTLQSAANIPQTVDLEAVLPDGLFLFGLNDVTLNPGETITRFLTFVPNADVPLHSTLTTSITADFGGGVPESRLIEIRIVAPGAEAAGNAASVVRDSLGNVALADRLDDLRIAITNKVQDPNSDVFAAQIMAALDATMRILETDEYLSPFVDQMTTVRDDFQSAEDEQACLDAIIELEILLESLTDAVVQIIRSRFEFFLTPNVQTTLPNVPRQFEIQLHNVGTHETVYAIRLDGLPPSVSHQLSQSFVTLAHDEFADVTLTLTETATDQLRDVDFSVIVSVDRTFPEMSKSLRGALRVRQEVVTIANVGIDPPFVDPGAAISVSARLLNSVNRNQSAQVFYRVTDSSGAEIASTVDSPVEVDLTIQTSLADVDLGTLDTTGLEQGQYDIHVFVRDENDQLIPGADSRNGFLVGSPVNASHFVDPVLLPPGNSLVNHTLQVNAPVPTGTPFELLSVIPVDDPESDNDLQGEIVDGVAAGGSLIYVLGAGGIQTFDVSDPSQPQFLGIARDRKHSFGEVVGDRLITAHVGETAIFNFGNIFQFNVFSLSGNGTPERPVRSAISNPGYLFANDLVIQGDRAYVPFFYFRVNDSIGDYIFQSGGMFSVDHTGSGNLTGTVFPNNNGNYSQSPVGRSGGDYIHFQSALADQGTLYTLSTTGFADNSPGPGESVNTDVNGDPAVGRILLYDISDPESLSFVGDSDPATTGFLIPGTQFLGGIGIEDDLAFVLGSEGGWREPYPSRAEINQTGNIVLTTLDVTDPRDPQILHSQTLDRDARGSQMVQPIGNDHFLFTSLGAVDDTPKLFVIDATDPTALTVAHEIDLPGTPIGTKPAIVDGSLLYLNLDNALMIYSLGDLGTTTVTVEVPVPNDNGVQLNEDSFNLSPTRIVPGVGADKLVWELAFGADSSSQELTWTTTVNDMQPGLSREVTRESNIQFRTPASGQVTLPAARVTSEHLIAISPPHRTVAGGVAAAYTLSVENVGGVETIYDLSLSGLADDWFVMPDQVAVPPGEKIDVALSITPPPLASQNNYEFVVSVSDGFAKDSVMGAVRVIGEPVFAEADGHAHGIVAEVMPIEAIVGQVGVASYTVRLTNVGSVAETFTLATSGVPVAWGSAFLRDNSEINEIELLPGAENFRDVSLQVTLPSGTDAGSYPFQVVATSTTDSSVEGRAAATTDVSTIGVDVIPETPTAQQSQRIEVEIVNTGSVSETFSLSLAAPASVTAELSLSSVTLGGGESQTETIDVGELDVAFPGAWELVVIAESETLPEVRDVESLAVAVPGQLGVNAEFRRKTIPLDESGQANTVLFVENIGNVSDQYTMSIKSASDGIDASFRDQDGRPVQTLPLFTLPGLARTAIALNTSMQRIAEGRVTVQVKSLTDDSIIAEDTVTLQAISRFDFGDAPDGIEVDGETRNYPTQLSNDGARHVIGDDGPFLGATIDDETDGQSDVMADGDANDEDGVLQVSSLVSNATTQNASAFLIVSSGNAKLDAWIDFNGNGAFDHPVEHLSSGESFDLVAGNNLLPVSVPPGSVAGASFARFRISSSGRLLPGGLASDGEVEDYRVEILDGEVGADVDWNLVVGSLDVQTMGNEVVVRHEQAEVFRAPGSAISSFHLIGTPDDDTVRLGNLSAAIAEPIPWSYAGEAGRDDLILTGSQQSLDLTEAGNSELSDLETIDIVGTGANAFAVDQEGVVGATNSQDRLILVHDDDDDVRYVADGWVVQSPIFVDGSQRHVLTNGFATIETQNHRPWTNPLFATDVNRSGDTTPLDALLVINFLARSGSDSILLTHPDSSESVAARYYDVNKSETASPIDALQPINFIAREQNSGEAEGGIDLLLLARSKPSDEATSDFMDSQFKRKRKPGFEAIDWLLAHWGE